MAFIYHPAPARKKHRFPRVFAFVFTFLLFSAVFAAVILWAITQFAPAAPESSSGYLPEFTAEDRGVLLVIFEQDRRAGGFVTVSADPAAGSITAAAFPRETVVEDGVSRIRLYELYAQPDGGAAAARTLSALTGEKIEKYMAVSIPNAGKIVNAFEKKLILELPEDVSYTDPESQYTIRLTAGRVTLNGSQAAALLRYNGWQQGRSQQSLIHAQMIAALINQYLIADRQDADDFAAIIDWVDSNIRIPDYERIKNGLDYLSEKNTGSVCTAVPAPGRYVGTADDVRFEVE
ncbi:MAG: LCP family protein [Oscillospiraceae bacterium]|nr:LCP family protein [Oscillospiraceae bacterium]